MSTLLGAFHVIELLAAGVILVFGIFFALNRMDKYTQHDIRISWVLLAGGAMAMFLWPAVAHPLILSGISLFVVADKRRGRVVGDGESVIEYM